MQPFAHTGQLRHWTLTLNLLWNSNISQASKQLFYSRILHECLHSRMQRSGNSYWDTKKEKEKTLTAKYNLIEVCPCGSLAHTLFLCVCWRQWSLVCWGGCDKNTDCLIRATLSPQSVKYFKDSSPAEARAALIWHHWHQNSVRKQSAITMKWYKISWWSKAKHSTAHTDWAKKRRQDKIKDKKTKETLSYTMAAHQPNDTGLASAAATVPRNEFVPEPDQTMAQWAAHQIV